jgi:hypothetical protein
MKLQKFSVVVYSGLTNWLTISLQVTENNNTIVLDKYASVSSSFYRNDQSNENQQNLAQSQSPGKKSSRLATAPVQECPFGLALLLDMILTGSSPPSYHSKLAAARERANSARTSPARRSAGAGLLELTGGLLVGAMPAICGPMPPSDGIGVGDGPRYVSKNDVVGGGISGGNWCGPARNDTMFQDTVSSCMCRC